MNKIGQWIRKLSHPGIIVAVLIILGVVVRYAQYHSDRPLWLDEAMLTVNILSRSYKELLTPLDFEQQAPIGFLLIEKLFVTLFGKDELVLRAFPLVASVMSLGAMAVLTIDILPVPFAYLAILLFVFSAPLIYYASEVKPYALDLTIGLFLTLLSVRIFITNHMKTDRALLTIFILGALGLWFSQAIVFILAAIGTVGMLRGLIKRNGRMFFVWAGISVGWLVSFLIQSSLTLGVYYTRYREIWAGYYAPFPPQSPADFRWYTDTVVQTFRQIGGIDLWPIGIVSAAVGVWYLYRTKPKLLVLLLLPAILAFIASALHYYPFADRFLLFFAPALLLLMTYGLWRICRWAWQSNWVSMRVISAIVIAELVINISYLGFYRLQHPVRSEVITPLLSYYQTHRQNGDTLYLYYASAFAFSFYSERYGIQPSDYIKGIDRTSDLTAYARDLKKLQGKAHVWVLFSHVYDWGGVDEEVYFLTQLDGMGRRTDEMHTDGADLYLYDLSQSP